MTRIPTLLLLISAAACYELTGPGLEFRTTNVTIDSAFHLHVGERAFVAEAELYVRFLDIVSDSRCPSDAQILCVWAGDGSIEVEIATLAGDTLVDTLHTMLQPGTTEVGPWTLDLLDLAPYPRDVEPIPLARYVATFDLRRRP